MSSKTRLALSRVYALLEPGPVVLVTTARKAERNIMTMSWHMMMEFEPPLLGCIISARNHSFELLDETGECGINIPTADLAEQVIACGNSSGKQVDKFEKFGLTPTPGSCISAPLIAECYASLECKVVDRTLVAQYNMFVLEVCQAWKDRSVKAPVTLHHEGKGVFRTAGETVKLRSRMK